MNAAIRVAVAGAAGRMGREVVRAIVEADDMEVAAAIDVASAGSDAGVLAGIGAIGIGLQTSLENALTEAGPDVLVDFTVPATAVENILCSLQSGVAAVVGTTGIADSALDRIQQSAEEARIAVLVAPNFAIGAVLLMQFARQAAAYLPDAEIIELHHEKKLDSPSGTAIRTARLIAEGRAASPIQPPAGTIEKIPGGRGAELQSVRIHSIRLPGCVAHQEVIFGGLGQTLTLRHDSLDRRSFMPGVLLAIRRIRRLQGLVVGLEHLL